MFAPEVVDQKTEYLGHSCRACCKALRKGQVVLHLKLGNNVSFDYRHQYFHASCMAETMEKADELVSVDAAWIEEMREKMIETGEFLVDA